MQTYVWTVVQVGIEFMARVDTCPHLFWVVGTRRAVASVGLWDTRCESVPREWSLRQAVVVARMAVP